MKILLKAFLFVLTFQAFAIAACDVKAKFGDKKKEVLVRAEYFYDFHLGLKKFLDCKKIHNILELLMGGRCILFKETQS